MSLNYNLSNVVIGYHEYLKRYPLQENGMPHATTEAVILSCMTLGLSGVHAENWTEFLIRHEIARRCLGEPMIWLPPKQLAQVVRDHIGLTTNSEQLDRETWFYRSVMRDMLENIAKDFAEVDDSFAATPRQALTRWPSPPVEVFEQIKRTVESMGEDDPEEGTIDLLDILRDAENERNPYGPQQFASGDVVEITQDLDLDDVIDFQRGIEDATFELEDVIDRLKQGLVGKVTEVSWASLPNGHSIITCWVVFTSRLYTFEIEVASARLKRKS